MTKSSNGKPTKPPTIEAMQKELDPKLLDILVCPACKASVELLEDKLVCSNSACNSSFPIVDGIPIMLKNLTEQDLKLSKEKWDREYESRRLGIADLESDLELRDAYLHVKRYGHHLKRGFFLEAGCGSSKLSCLLSREGVRTIGLDFSLNALMLSKQLFDREGTPGSFVCGDIMEMPFKNDVFSFIYTGGVLEHFKDTQRAVDSIYRCSTCGGFTTNTVPCLSLSTLYRMLRWGNVPDIPLLRKLVEFIDITILKGKRLRFGYEKSFPISKIRRIFEKAGFENVEIGLFKTYYVLNWTDSKCLRLAVTRLANSNRMFWPMIYVSAIKSTC